MTNDILPKNGTFDYEYSNNVYSSYDYSRAELIFVSNDESFLATLIRFLELKYNSKQPQFLKIKLDLNKFFL